MAKTKIYFWLKIDKKFFDNIFIKRLKTVPGGYTMTVIYIRLMLESLESDCILYYEGYFDNLKEELALKLDVSEDDIDMTMAYFTKCGLIQVDEDKNAELPQAKALVQQETNQAAYMREYRKQQREQKENLTMLSKNLTLSTTCKTEIEKEKEKEIEKEIDSSAKSTTTKRKRFEKPTIFDVEQYCIERNNNVDPQHFVDYYESNGWKVGKNSMKDWKAAVRTWERSEYRKPNSKKNSKEDAINVVNNLMNKLGGVDAEQPTTDLESAIDVTDSVVY